MMQEDIIAGSMKSPRPIREETPGEFGSEHRVCTLASAGTPALGPGPLYPVFKRRIPEPIFYIVPALMWLALSVRHLSLTLPTAANPSMEAGGFLGESKIQGLTLFGQRALRSLAPFIVLPAAEPTTTPEARCVVAVEALARIGLEFPLVAKPDIGYQGWGVRLVTNENSLLEYLANCGPEVKLLLQKLVELPGEAGVFYIRRPGEAKGHIVSMAFAYAAHVTGDGISTMEALVEQDDVLRKNSEIYRVRNLRRWEQVVGAGEVCPLLGARSARLGAVFRDAGQYVTPDLREAVDTIALDIRDLHFGRFDIRFESVAALGRGEFEILELNGAGAEMLHIWDGRYGLSTAYRALWQQYRTLFSIGAEMRRRGHRPLGLRAVASMIVNQEKARCHYPVSG